jgi:hypothetical protein
MSARRSRDIPRCRRTRWKSWWRIQARGSDLAWRGIQTSSRPCSRGWPATVIATYALPWPGIPACLLTSSSICSGTRIGSCGHNWQNIRSCRWHNKASFALIRRSTCGMLSELRQAESRSSKTSPLLAGMAGMATHDGPGRELRPCAERNASGIGMDNLSRQVANAIVARSSGIVSRCPGVVADRSGPRLRTSQQRPSAGAWQVVPGWFSAGCGRLTGGIWRRPSDDRHPEMAQSSADALRTTGRLRRGKHLGYVAARRSEQMRCLMPHSNESKPLLVLAERRDLLLTETHALDIHRPVLLQTKEMSIMRLEWSINAISSA